MDRQDVRVLEAGGDGDLAQEALGAERLAQLGVEHLERDRPVVLEVVDQVDRGHAAPAELALDFVAVVECVGQARLDASHEYQRRKEISSNVRA